MTGIRLITAACVVFVMLSSIEAHDQVPGAPQLRPIVIRNATVHVVDGADINMGMYFSKLVKLLVLVKSSKLRKKPWKLMAPGSTCTLA